MQWRKSLKLNAAIQAAAINEAQFIL